MELKTLDDPDLRNITLAALDAFEKCLGPKEQALKIAANTVYKEISDAQRLKSQNCRGNSDIAHKSVSSDKHASEISDMLG